MEHLIPDAPFVAMPAIMLVMILAAGIYFLIKGADWLVEGASGIALRMGISKIVIGATVVSLGTTSPEAAVSVMAAFSGNAGLALGNAVGSIIADTGLIFGIGCLMATLPADRFVLSRQGWVQRGSGVLLAAMCYGVWLIAGDDAALGRPVGFVLLALLAAYMYFSVRWSREHPEGEPFQTPDDMAGTAPMTGSIDVHALRSLPMLIGLGLVGLVLVLLSSRFVIGSVTVLADRAGVPQVVVASTIVALGTSLPELVVGITAVLKGHRELLVGNVIGADVLNVLFVVGASAAAANLPIIDHKATNPHIFLMLQLPTMLVILVLFRVFIFQTRRTGEFRRWMGVPLLAIYALFLLLNVLMSGSLPTH